MRGESEEVLNLEECMKSAAEMPQVELIVDGQRVTCLCDMGATRTVLKETIRGAHLSGSTILARSANGGLNRERLTEPICITDPETDKSHTGPIVT